MCLNNILPLRHNILNNNLYLILNFVYVKIQIEFFLQKLAYNINNIFCPRSSCTSIYFIVYLYVHIYRNIKNIQQTVYIYLVCSSFHLFFFISQNIAVEKITEFNLDSRVTILDPIKHFNRDQFRLTYAQQQSLNKGNFTRPASKNNTLR